MYVNSSFPQTLIFSAVLLALGCDAADLRTAAQRDTAPKYTTLPDGAVGGLCVDLLRAIERAEPELHFVGDQHWKPVIRVLSEMYAGLQDAACGLARTPDRQAHMIYLEPALFSVEHVLVSRIDDDIAVGSWDDLRKLGRQATVLVDRGLYPAYLVETIGGIAYDAGSATALQNLQKLVAGRGRLYLHRLQGLDVLLRESGLAGRVRVLPTVLDSVPLYFTLGMQVDDTTVQQVRRALLTLQKTGELDRIYKRWY